jgi:hypoxanthine phosphoribosyltransferase
MKIMKNMKNNIQIILYILFLILYYFFIINPLEKKIFKNYFYNDKRPLKTCVRDCSFDCYGMPSGHTEVATLVSFILYYKKYIGLPLAVIFIGLIAFQRLFTSMHTIYQVIAGFVLGFIYSFIFMKLDNLLYFFIFILFLTFTLLFTYIYIIDKKMNQYPEWIDKSLIPIMEKKQNVPTYLKMYDCICFYYLEWKELETYMDILVDKIKKTNIKFDCIVGIKSGGAILTKYIADKLKLKYYYIKISDKKHNCNSKTVLTNINYSLTNIVLKPKNEFVICEEIKDNIENQKVLLFDECVLTGNTMNLSMDYLYNNKKASYVLPCTISTTKENIFSVYNKELKVLFPWGYDN